MLLCMPRCELVAKRKKNKKAWKNVWKALCAWISCFMRKIKLLSMKQVIPESRTVACLPKYLKYKNNNYQLVINIYARKFILHKMLSCFNCKFWTKYMYKHILSTAPLKRSQYSLECHIQGWRNLKLFTVV